MHGGRITGSDDAICRLVICTMKEGRVCRQQALIQRKEIRVMRQHLFAVPLALLLASAGTATAQDVRYNFDKQTDFGTFKTYKWVALKNAPPLSDLVDRQVKST